jgi:uncharacterized membrane protein
MEAKPGRPPQIDPIGENVSESVKETGRIEAFSDGVFAIAITLLVLELRVPPSHELTGTLLNALLERWPSYIAFVTSFLIIGIMWGNHHYMFKTINRTNQPFLFLNLFLLMGITLVPFPTALMADYLQHRDANVAAVVYSGLFFMIAVFFNVMWWYAAKNRRLISPTADPALIQNINSSFRFGPLLYLLALVLAFFSVPLSLGLHLALAIFYAFTGLINRQSSVS